MITGIILAGGKNKRIGKEKSLLLIQEKPIIYWIVKRIRLFVNEIIVITNKKYLYNFLDNVTFKKDIIRNKGPIGGIYTGLYYSKTKFSFIVACDMPYIKGEIIPFLQSKIKNSLGAIPYGDNYFETLSAIYSKELTDSFKLFIDRNNLKLQNVLNDFKLKRVDTKSIYKNFGKEIFININTKDRYRKILKDIHDNEF